MDGKGPDETHWHGSKQPPMQTIEDELTAVRVALQNNDFTVTMYDGGLHLAKRTESADPAVGAEIREEAASILETVLGSSPDLKPASGASEGEVAFELYLV